jgi:hypothetical protein
MAVKHSNFVGGTIKPQRRLSMKKNTFFEVLAILLSFTIGFAACGRDSASSSKVAPSSDFEFTFNDKDETVTITGYSGKGGKVVIPSEIEGYPVVAISGNAFAAKWTERKLVYDQQKFLVAADEAYKRGVSTTSPRYPKSTDMEFNHWEETNNENPAAALITDITIPESITNVGGQGFKGCANLVSVILLGEVKFAGQGEFSGCSKLSIATRQALKEAGYGGSF